MEAAAGQVVGIMADVAFSLLVCIPGSKFSTFLLLALLWMLHMTVSLLIHGQVHSGHLPME